MKPLHEMTVAELMAARRDAKLNAVSIQAAMRGTRGKDKIELEEAAYENRSYIKTINARIARLERVGRQ